MVERTTNDHIESDQVSTMTLQARKSSKDEMNARPMIRYRRKILAGHALIGRKLPAIVRLMRWLDVAWDMRLSSQVQHRDFLWCSRAEARDADRSRLQSGAGLDPASGSGAGLAFGAFLQGAKMRTVQRAQMSASRRR